jgi:putative membrane protein
MYLFSLPFVLVKELGWATVPVVTVVAFTFMGIETIADIIEMPFGMCFQLSIVPSLTLERR